MILIINQIKITTIFFLLLIVTSSPIHLKTTNDKDLIILPISLGNQKLHAQVDLGSSFLAVNTNSQYNHVSTFGFYDNTTSPSFGGFGDLKMDGYFADGEQTVGIGGFDTLYLDGYDDAIGNFQIGMIDKDSPMDMNVFGIGSLIGSDISLFGTNSSLLSVLKSRGDISKRIVNMYDGTGLVLGGVNTEAFVSSSLVYVNALSNNNYDVGVYIKIQSFTVTPQCGTDVGVINASQYQALIDSGSNGFGLPSDIFHYTMTQLNAYQLTNSDYSSDFNPYVFKCSDAKDLVFDLGSSGSIGGKTFLHSNAYAFELIDSYGETVTDSKGNTLCSSSLVEISSEQGDMFVFGAPFFRKNYVIIDYENGIVGFADHFDSGKVQLSEDLPTGGITVTAGYPSSTISGNLVTQSTTSLSGTGISRAGLFNGPVVSVCDISTRSVHVTYTKTSYYCPECVSSTIRPSSLQIPTPSTTDSVTASNKASFSTGSTRHISVRYTITSYYCPECTSHFTTLRPGSSDISYSRFTSASSSVVTSCSTASVIDPPLYISPLFSTTKTPVSSTTTQPNFSSTFLESTTSSSKQFTSDSNNRESIVESTSSFSSNHFQIISTTSTETTPIINISESYPSEVVIKSGFTANNSSNFEIQTYEGRAASVSSEGLVPCLGLIIFGLVSLI